MQRDLQATLAEQRHLADLGLAVSKINHDLRNMLASAQLFSDRLGGLPDPTVQRFAPKLIAALDRAIAYCQSTLAYGRAARGAARAPPGRARPPGRRGRRCARPRRPSDASPSRTRCPPGLEIDADPDQLFRVLVNLGRNAVQALDGDVETRRVVRRLTIGARARRRRGGRSASRTPGRACPEKARAHLFQAFQGGARPGGTGLGLAIAAELVRAHGGTHRAGRPGGPRRALRDHASPTGRRPQGRNGGLRRVAQRERPRLALAFAPAIH